MIPKELWLKNITDSIKEIASLEFQEKGWVRNEIHDYCTFVETACGFFQDDDIENFLNEYAKPFGLSDFQIKKIDQLRIAFDSYTNEHGCYEDPAIIIKDPEWIKIRGMAQEALKALGIERYLDPSKDILKSGLLYRIDDIADKKSQQRIWIDERRPGYNPFQNIIKSFFETYKTKKILENYKDYEITDPQRESLAKLYDELERYRLKAEGEEDLEKILKDPEWHQIQDLAKEVMKAFDFKR